MHYYPPLKYQTSSIPCSSVTFLRRCISHITGNRKQQPAKLCPPTSANHCLDKSKLAPSSVRQTMSHKFIAPATGINSTTANKWPNATKASLDLSIRTPTASHVLDESNINQAQPQNDVEMEGDSNIAKVLI